MSSHQHIHSVQALRGLAALFVVLLHLAGGAKEYYENDVFQRLFSFGHCGVDIFFVISGFIMMWVHKRDIGHPQQWIVYLKRRMWRIYPTYWMAFLLPFCIYFFQGRIGDNKEMSVFDVIKSFFLLPQEGRTVLVVSWTLVYEVIFYLFFGSLILNKRLGLMTLGIWLGSILIFNFFMTFPMELRHFFDLRNLEFFIGMGIAFIIQRNKIYLAEILWKIAIVILLCGMIFNWFVPITAYWLAVIPTTLFLLGAIRSENCNKHVPQFLINLGTISYSLYLVHTPILLMSYKTLIALKINHPLFAFLLSFIFCIAGGFIFYNLIEKSKLTQRRGLHQSFTESPIRKIR